MGPSSVTPGELRALKKVLQADHTAAMAEGRAPKVSKLDRAGYGIIEFVHSMRSVLTAKKVEMAAGHNYWEILNGDFGFRQFNNGLAAQHGFATTATMGALGGEMTDAAAASRR